MVVYQWGLCRLACPGPFSEIYTRAIPQVMARLTDDATIPLIFPSGGCVTLSKG